MLDLIIHNGHVILPDCTIDTSIAIDDGKIVSIGSRHVMPKGEKVINAQGKIILPGGIDPHDHTGAQGWFPGSKATSWGGTTTLINFSTDGMKGLEKLRGEVDSQIVIDYAFHAKIDNMTPNEPGFLDEVKKLIEYGVPSFKLFMFFEDRVDDNTILKMLEACKVHRGIVCLHAENHDMIMFNQADAVMKGDVEAIYHAWTRPSITESESVNRALYLSSYTKAPYMNMHLSIKEGVDLLRAARRKGELVYAETTPLYLCRTEDDLKGPRGIYYICAPPLRTKDHVIALWNGLADGTISVVGTDGGTKTTEVKKGYDNFAEVPNGTTGHEFRLPILYSEGVGKGRISVNRLSEIFSTNAAKIYGMYPKKGIINIGSDADLVILDPKLEQTVTADMSMTNIDWYPFEGMHLKGWPVITISKGRVIWEDGVFQGKQGDGNFLNRKLSDSLFERLIA